MIDIIRLEQMQAHVDEGGKMQPEIVQELINEVRRMQEKLMKYSHAVEMYAPEIFDEINGHNTSKGSEQ